MSIILSNSTLELEIQKPGEKYRGSRFDWTGQITQIIYKNNHTFCTNETLIPAKKNHLGRGLYNEFGVDEVYGCYKSNAGYQFLKIGIGTLVKGNDEKYNFHKLYAINPAQFKQEYGKDYALFSSVCQPFNGRGFKLIKMVKLNGNSFSISYELFNTGSKQINTNEYVHNFLSINNRKIDDNYELRFSAPLRQNGEITNPENKIQFKNSIVSWKDKIKEEFFFSNIMPTFETAPSWNLENKIDKIGIKESCNFVPIQVNLWGSNHVVSPEIFNKVIVQPGKSICWQRKYEVYEL